VSDKHLTALGLKPGYPQRQNSPDFSRCHSERSEEPLLRK
jgi:hypothetical protein